MGDASLLVERWEWNGQVQESLGPNGGLVYLLVGHRREHAASMLPLHPTHQIGGLELRFVDTQTEEVVAEYDGLVHPLEKSSLAY